MDLLLRTPTQAQKLFKQSSIFENNVLGMTSEGEKVSRWLLGDADNGYDVTVGFFNDKARYVAFKKRRGDQWEEADSRACLGLIGPWRNWISRPGSEFFDYEEREGGNPANPIIASATGWQASRRRYAFAYVPTIPGDVAISPVRTAIDARFAR